MLTAQNELKGRVALVTGGSKGSVCRWYAKWSY